MTKSGYMKKLQTALETFANKRDWQRFHSPKNLAMALAVETAELVEIFQWLETEESRHVDNATLAHIEEEVGDIMIYLALLAGKFNIDPIAAGHKKMMANEKRYPAEKVRGKSTKYNRY